MSPIKRHLGGDANAEIFTLIETLHQTERRLEQLTAGEVDTVTDREGRALLLRRAQDHLRHNDAAKQAAILDALPANIALLDAQGNILSVNQAWQRFAGANALQGGHVGIGINYLAICDSAEGDGAAEAWQAAAGIRSVFDGAESSFSMEYPCHSPAEQRWFMMTVTPLAGEHPNCAVVMHLNITERKRASEALRESEQRIRAITANTPGMVFQCVLDTKSGLFRFTYVSEGGRFLLGLAPDAIQANWNTATALLVEPDRETFHASLHHSANAMETWNWEGRSVLVDGMEKWINGRATPRFSDEGDVIWEGVMLNITESKLGEQALIQSGQLLRELSAYSENTREEERKRIAREVHDELGQALTVLRLDLGLLRLHFGAQNPQLVERIRLIKVGVDRTIKIMRHVTSTLRPVALDLGLIAGLEWLVEEFNLHSGTKCRLMAGGCEEVNLDDGRATAIFRIVQESLNNVLRHAEASKVNVSIELDGDEGIFLDVHDDGKGFDPESQEVVRSSPHPRI